MKLFSVKVWAVLKFYNNFQPSEKINTKKNNGINLFKNQVNQLQHLDDIPTFCFLLDTSFEKLTQSPFLLRLVHRFKKTQCLFFI